MSWNHGSPYALDSSLLVIVSQLVVLEDEVRPATVVVSKETGKIVEIYSEILDPYAFGVKVDYHDLSSRVLMPGLVDSHVHLNEPGRTSTEGFYTGTRSAVTGGVTTVIDMPLNSIPPTTTVHGLNAKIAAARDQSWCDVGFLGGIVPGNVKELKPLVEAGVRGFKSFLIYSGVDEFPAVSREDLRVAMHELADSPTMLMFHAEKMPSHSSVPGGFPPILYPSRDKRPARVYDNYLSSNPPSLEETAIKMIIDVSSFAPELPLHIAHLSTAEAIPILEKAQKDGVNLSVETCFHYLALTKEDILQGDTRYKCDPPIRGRDNRKALWAALHDADTNKPPGKRPLVPSTPKLITTVVSDHSPCAPSAKLLPSHIPPHYQVGELHGEVVNDSEGDFFKAWGGISSIGLGLPVLWTTMSPSDTTGSPSCGEKADDEQSGGPHGHSWDIKSALLDISRWCCQGTALLVGLGTSKGRIAVGYDADFCVFDPNIEWTVKTKDLEFKHKMSPYVGRSLRGRVVGSYLRGTKVWELEHDTNGRFLSERPHGKLLLEKRRSKTSDATMPVTTSQSLAMLPWTNGLPSWLQSCLSPILGCIGRD